MPEYEEMIPEEMFDLTNLKSERFLGKIHKCRIQDGTLSWSAGQKVWYLEVENLSRPFPWGNIAKEIRPMRGANTSWTKLIEAFKNIGVNINPATIKAQEGRILWFEMTDLRFGERTVKNFIYPVSVPTTEEVEQVISLRGAATDEVLDQDVVEVATPSEDPDALILSIADGLTRDQLIESSLAMFPEIFSDKGQVLTRVTNLIKSGKIQLAGGKIKVK